MKFGTVIMLRKLLDKLNFQEFLVIKYKYIFLSYSCFPAVSGLLRQELQGQP
jgi:hypothetical protein